MPPLNNDQRYEIKRATLQSLIAGLAEARSSGSDPDIIRAKQELSDFSSSYDDLNKAAQDAFDAAHIEDLDQAVGKFAEIANEIGQEGGEIKSGLQEAMAAAKSGKKELLVPRVAETASRTLAELKTLKGGMDSLAQQVGGANDLQDICNLLPGAITQLKALRQAAENISS